MRLYPQKTYHVFMQVILYAIILYITEMQAQAQSGINFSHLCDIAVRTVCSNSSDNKENEALISCINTHGNGVPVVVFNSLPWTRTDTVTAASPFAGQNTNVRIIDSSGHEYAARSLGDVLCFTARDVPALGYKVFWACRCEKTVFSGIKITDSIVENQYFRIRIDPKLGVITGIYDKISKRNIIRPGDRSALLQILLEESRNASISKFSKSIEKKNLIGNSELIIQDQGPAKAVITFDHDYNTSVFTQELSLYDGVPRIDIQMTADWRKRSAEVDSHTMLQVIFPINLKIESATFETPSGSVEHATTGKEYACGKWIDLSNKDYGISFLGDGKYGFNVGNGEICLMLLRPTDKNDPMSDADVHEMVYSLYPHRNGWREADTVRRSFELNNPLTAQVTEDHTGLLSDQKSFLSIDAPGVMITSITKSENDDSLLLCLREVYGKPCVSKVRVGLPISSCYKIDLGSSDNIPVENNTFTVNLGKWETKTYRLVVANH